MPAAPLLSAHRTSRLLDADVKSQKLEPSKTGSFLKQEPGEERPELDAAPEPLAPLRQSCSPVPAGPELEVSRPAPMPQSQPLPLRLPSPPLQQGQGPGKVREEEEQGGPIKIEVSSYSCQAAYDLPPSRAEAESETQISQEPDRATYPPVLTADSDDQELSRMRAAVEQSTSAACEQEQLDTPVAPLPPSQRESVPEPVCPPSAPSSPLPLVLGPEDPMGGMLALLAASEMARARPGSPPAPTLVSQAETPPAAPEGGAALLEMVALEGMALLSQMAQHEIHHISQEQGKLSQEKKTNGSTL